MIYLLLFLFTISSCFIAEKYVKKFIPFDTDNHVVYGWKLYKLLFVAQLFLLTGVFSVTEYFELWMFFGITLLALIDIQSKVLPTKIIRFFVLTSLITILLFERSIDIVVSTMLSGLVFYVFLMIIFFMSGGKIYGFGDVRYAFLLGMFLAGSTINLDDFIVFFTDINLVMIFSSGLFLLHSWIVKLVNKTDNFLKLEVPFGPALGLATLITHFL